MSNPSPKKVKDMTDEELKELRFNESVIGTFQEVLVTGVYSQDGQVIGTPVDSDAREKASREAKAIVFQKFRASIPRPSNEQN